jgi:hypothetical protein
MKKVKVLLSLVLMGVVFSSYAQSDFFTGKWDMLIKETPNGDAKMTAVFIRLDGKLKGELLPVDGSDAIPVSKIEEESNAITIYFSAQGYDLSVKLAKVDESNLKGSLMDMFETTLVRKPEADFYTGKWEMLVIGTPNGDSKMIVTLKREEGKLRGNLKPLDSEDYINITEIEEGQDKVTLYFTAQGYDVNVVLTKVDADNMKGSLMNMFDTSAKRMK